MPSKSQLPWRRQMAVNNPLRYSDYLKLPGDLDWWESKGKAMAEAKLRREAAR